MTFAAASDSHSLFARQRLSPTAAPTAACGEVDRAAAAKLALHRRLLEHGRGGAGGSFSPT